MKNETKQFPVQAIARSEKTDEAVINEVASGMRCIGCHPQGHGIGYCDKHSTSGRAYISEYYELLQISDPATGETKTILLNKKGFTPNP